jgi:hypothetical protein
VSAAGVVCCVGRFLCSHRVLLGVCVLVCACVWLCVWLCVCVCSMDATRGQQLYSVGVSRCPHGHPPPPLLHGAFAFSKHPSLPPGAPSWRSSTCMTCVLLPHLCGCLLVAAFRSWPFFLVFLVAAVRPAPFASCSPAPHHLLARFQALRTHRKDLIMTFENEPPEYDQNLGARCCWRRQPAMLLLLLLASKSLALPQRIGRHCPDAAKQRRLQAPRIQHPPATSMCSLPAPLLSRTATATPPAHSLTVHTRNPNGVRPLVPVRLCRVSVRLFCCRGRGRPPCGAHHCPQEGVGAVRGEREELRAVERKRVRALATVTTCA